MKNEKSRKKVILIIALALLFIVSAGIITAAMFLHKPEKADGTDKGVTSEEVVLDNTEKADTEETNENAQEGTDTELLAVTDKDTEDGTEKDTTEQIADNDTTEAPESLQNGNNGGNTNNPTNGGGNGQNKPTNSTQPTVSNDSKPTDTTTDTPTTPAPTTTEEKEQIWHEPVIEEVWVVDKAAWDEELPIMDYIAKDVCNGCGADVTNCIDTHFTRETILNGCGGYHSEYEWYQTGTQIVHHDEEGHWEVVVVKEGYWE